MSGARPTAARTTVVLGLVDQVVSSGSTFLFLVVAASALPARDFGAVAFAFEVYLLSVFVGRGLAGDPLMSTFSGRSADRVRSGTSGAITTCLGGAVVLGVVVATVASFLGDPLRPVLLVASVALPGLVLQDLVRSALIVQGRVGATLVNDAVWAFGQLPVLALVISQEPTAVTVCAGWAATGCCAAVLGLFQLRVRPGRPSSVRRWLRDTKEVWPFYLVDNMVYQLASFALTLVVSLTAGLTAVAAFRVAMTVYAPLLIIGRGVVPVGVTLLARDRERPDHVRRRALQISALLTPVALVAGAVTLVVPRRWGTAVFGESWVAAEPVVFLACFVCAAGLFSIGVSIGLRALSAGRQSLTARLVVTAGAAVAALVGGVLGQEHGLFLALALYFPVQAGVWWWMLRNAAREARERLAAEDGPRVA